jgi:hypothetical protein
MMLKGLFRVGGIDQFPNLKKRDSVCIVYLGNMPCKNSPLGYFENGKIKCSCKK